MLYTSLFLLSLFLSAVLKRKKWDATSAILVKKSVNLDNNDSIKHQIHPSILYTHFTLKSGVTEVSWSLSHLLWGEGGSGRYKNQMLSNKKNNDQKTG